MTQENYDVAIAYRIYPGIAKLTPVYDTNKYELAELCLRTFKRSLGSLRAKMFVLSDNCPSEYEKLFRQHFLDDDLQIIRLNGIGNYGTFKKQIEILAEQNFSEVVYLAEDDYFYFPYKFASMIEFIKTDKEVDFISPYDHTDLYTHELHNHGNYIKVFDNHHWRSANSTCLTFLTTRKTLLETKRVFLTFAEGNHDASLWLSLTKYKLNLFQNFIYRFTNYQLFDIAKKAWSYCWWQILFGRRRKLWIPIPAYATHMLTGFLSPAFDWRSVIAREIADQQCEKVMKLQYRNL